MLRDKFLVAYLATLIFFKIIFPSICRRLNGAILTVIGIPTMAYKSESQLLTAGAKGSRKHLSERKEDDCLPMNFAYGAPA